jgi:protein subunit release factor B
MKNCYVIVQPGAGGDNTKDRATDLVGAILKACSKRGLQAELEDELTLYVRGGL